ncbi:MAG: triose-phosphate isomerase [Cytophagales bacterium]|nr:triose-phosphate isomerase [Cytophagales bacterium]
MRKNIIAGNWKMNKSIDEGKTLASSVVNMVSSKLPGDAEVIIIPPFVHLTPVKDQIESALNISLGAQNCSNHDSGAYTGEVSANMLRNVGVKYVIVGHSERREFFNEDNAIMAEKTTKALAAGLIPIFCCGESLEVRKAGEHEKFVSNQIEEGLFHLSLDEMSKVVIAYEPIWAIGTGETASTKQVQEMHRSIRLMLMDQYGDAAAEETSILYGGSVKPENAEELFSQSDVDGGLVGGASLKAQDFVDIANSFK